MTVHVVREAPGRYARWQILTHPDGREVAAYVSQFAAHAEAQRLNGGQP